MPIADLMAAFRSRFSTYTPVVHLLEDSITGEPSNQLATDQAAHVADQTLHSCEQGSGEPLDTVGYWEKASVDASGATVVYSGACIYGGFIVLGAAGAHTMDVYDNTSAAGVKVLNAQSVNSAADGTKTIGIKMSNGITANLSGNPTDGLILVLYKPLPA